MQYITCVCAQVECARPSLATVGSCHLYFLCYHKYIIPSRIHPSRTNDPILIDESAWNMSRWTSYRSVNVPRCEQTSRYLEPVIVELSRRLEACRAVPCVCHSAMLPRATCRYAPLRNATCRYDAWSRATQLQDTAPHSPLQGQSTVNHNTCFVYKSLF